MIADPPGPRERNGPVHAGRSSNGAEGYMMLGRMARWNYYFASCHAITSKGKTVELPAGHGMVTLDADAAAESVFFSGGSGAIRTSAGRGSASGKKRAGGTARIGAPRLPELRPASGRQSPVELRRARG